MTDRSTSKEVLDKIKNVKPKPRWEFLLKNYFVWLLGLISIILGSLAFATIIYMMINNDWDVHHHIAGSMPKFILLTLPYFWLIFLGLFILSAYINFKHTKKGYKFPLPKVIVGSVVISILFGALFYNVGVGQAIDDIMEKRMPFYKELVNKRKDIWLRHDEGFLAGVVAGQEDELLIIHDIENNAWYVSDIEKSLPPVMPPGFAIEEGVRLRIIGEHIDTNYFKAEQVLPMRGMPWLKGCQGPCEMMKKLHERKVKGKRIIR